MAAGRPADILPKRFQFRGDMIRRRVYVAATFVAALAAGRTPYDRATSCFAPDGTLHQVDYARAAAGRGSLAVVLSNMDAAVICVARDSDVAEPLRLDDPSSSKVFFVDDRVAVVFSGLAADGRVLANRARLECQRHRLMAGAPASVSHVAAHVAGLMHECTRTGARRLFGVECLVVGFEPDTRTAALERRRAWVPRLFHTDPSGSLNEWTAGAIGARAGEARELLESAADGLGEMGLDEIAALASRIVSDSSDDRTVPVITLIDAKTKR